jgi:hypothetical protein
MKTKLASCLLLSAALLPVGAAPEPVKVELRADSMKVAGQTTVATGSAVAIIGDMRISAERIVSDARSGELKCFGDTTITSGQVTIKTRDARIDTTPPKPPGTPLPLREIRDLPSPTRNF